MRISGRYGLSFYDKATGHNIVPRFKELLQTQWLSAEELKALQLRRLQALLEYAYAYVPYYQRVFDKVNFRPSELTRDPDSLQRIPPVSKAEMREHAEEFLTTDLDRRRALSQDATTGSTGEPFVFWEDHQTQDYAVANTLRHHTWCGWQPGQPRAYLWGLPYEMTLKQKLWLKARYFSWDLFFANAFNPTPETMSHLARLIRKRKPKLLHGYASALYVFARFVQENGWNDVKLPAVYSTSGILYPSQKECIEDTFACKVFNRYATQEVSGIACECAEHRGMHISAETNYVEILDGDYMSVKDGETGYVVVTNLTNYVFPFIRYRQDDFARKSDHGQCPCGREQPLLEAIEGRSHDLFLSPDGHRTALWGIDLPFRAMEGVRKFQVVQKSVSHIVVRAVKKDGPMSPVQRANVERVIKFALGGQFKIDYEYPDDIPIGPSGKYRYTICEIEQ